MSAPALSPAASPNRRNWTLFLLAMIFLGVASGTYDTIFNNYLSDAFHMTARTRGILEIPRELPGMGIVLITAMLAFIPEVRVAALAVGLWAVGAFGVGYLSPDLSWLVVWMVLGSAGQHLFMPLNQSIGVEIANGEAVGRKLGLLGGANTGAVITGAGLVMLGTRFLGLHYRGIIAISAGCTCLAMCCLMPMRVRRQAEAKSAKRFVYRRSYHLFYLLNILYGSRKQLFLTFGPWVLIKIYRQTPAAIAALFIVFSALGVVFKPWLGRMVDRYGERRILMGEALALIVVCLGYASGSILRGAGLYIVYACYIADQLLVAAGIARTTYLCKIAEDGQDLTPTLSLGISIDHVFSVSVAAIGGLVWAAWGYQYVFLGAAVIAVGNFFAARRVRCACPEMPAAAAS